MQWTTPSYPGNWNSPPPQFIHIEKPIYKGWQNRTVIFSSVIKKRERERFQNSIIHFHIYTRGKNKRVLQQIPSIWRNDSIFNCNCYMVRNLKHSNLPYCLGVKSNIQKVNRKTIMLQKKCRISPIMLGTIRTTDEQELHFV